MHFFALFDNFLTVSPHSLKNILNRGSFFDNLTETPSPFSPLLPNEKGKKERLPESRESLGFRNHAPTVIVCAVNGLLLEPLLARTV